MKTIKLVTVTGRGVKVERIQVATWSVWVKDGGEWFEVNDNLTADEAKAMAADIKGRESFQRVTYLPTGTDARQLG